MQDQTIDPIKAAIAHVESGGKYDALGAPSNGDRAYGKYQVMGSNIPKWTQEATGTSATPEQFLNNPDLQEKVASTKIGQLYGQYKNPADVASVWFTGQPASQSAGKKDVTGTTATDYINRVLSHLGTKAEAADNTQPQKHLSQDQIKANIDAMEQQGAPHDVIQGYLDSLKDTSSPSSGDASFKSLIQKNQTPSEDNSLKTDTGGVQGLLGNLWKGAGYAASNALGTQKNVVDAQNRNSDIESNLINQIKKDKSKGKDTSRLQKALVSLGSNNQKTGNQVGDAGTGGITTGDIVKSGLTNAAAIPAAIYGSGLIGSALSGKAALKAPEIAYNIPMTMEKFETLGDTEKLNVLGEALKTAEQGDAVKIAEAMKALQPGQGFLSKLASGGLSMAKQYLLTKALGDTVGGLIHKSTGN